MQVTFDRKPVDDNWVVSMSIDALNPREREQLAGFGPFLLDVGGTFVSGGTSFALPTKEVMVPTEFPQKVLFSVETLTAQVAATQAAVWEALMEARLQDALTDWLAFDPTTTTSRRTVTITPTP